MLQLVKAQFACALTFLNLYCICIFMCTLYSVLNTNLVSFKTLRGYQICLLAEALNVSGSATVRYSLCSLCCGWWLVLICCERKILLSRWWLLLVWCVRKTLLAGCSEKSDYSITGAHIRNRQIVSQIGS